MNLSQSVLMSNHKISPIGEVKQWYVDNTKNILKILNTRTTSVNLKTTSLEEIFKTIIKEIKISEDTIHIKLNKNLIIESNNIAQISSGLNIQLAKQIHLNPVLGNLKN